MAAGDSKYSCQTAAQTLEWIEAITRFIKPYDVLINAHIVNFFQDELWKTVDEDWTYCLRNEPVENLLLIPSGVVQDHWPGSLKQFILGIKCVAFPREQADLQAVIPGLRVGSLNNVLTQGMNHKKKHEVEILSAVVSSIANDVRVHTIVDVGSGQGYLAQVLSFQHELSVIAIDACADHGKVTNARAEKIKKYYHSHRHKSSLGNKKFNVPKTVTCHVMSADMMRTLSEASLHADEQSRPIGHDYEDDDKKMHLPSPSSDNAVSFVLAGLHACGDLSVTMIKSFLECKEIKAMVSVGCCYNLLSEENFEMTGSCCGFPMSNGVVGAAVSLGKRARDLACQSADRWRILGKDAGLHNFELHAFRAVFQLVLSKHYPEVINTSPSVGRQGKAFRRQQQRRVLELGLNHKDGDILGPDMNSSDAGASSDNYRKCEGTALVDKFSSFEKFYQSRMSRIGLKSSPDIDLLKLWNEAEPFTELIGPYWSIRAALGAVLETLILLDRLLFLQEQGSSVQVSMIPIFDPALSPRNVAIIAKRL